MNFKRGISDQAFNKTNVKEFWKNELGRDIAQCQYNGKEQFQICIRNNYFNVYWRGNSVLKYSPNATQHPYLIHHKFVGSDDCKATYVDLKYKDGDLVYNDKWSFNDNIIIPAKKKGHIPAIVEGKSTENSEKEKIAGYLENESPHWLDLEIAFSRKNESKKNVADRIDLAVIVQKNNIPILQLIEVKVADDSRLCAIDTPKIFSQMKRYKDFIDEQKQNLGKSYRAIAKNMLDLGIAQIDQDLLKRFATNGEIDDFPYLLVIGDITKLEIGTYGNHWETLCGWSEKNSFPAPIKYCFG